MNTRYRKDNKMNETKRTAEVSQIASLIRAKAQKHPEVIDIVSLWLTGYHRAASRRLKRWASSLNSMRAIILLL